MALLAAYAVPIRRSSCPPSGAARRRPSPTPSPPIARSPDAWPPTDPTLSSSRRPTRRSTRRVLHRRHAGGNWLAGAFGQPGERMTTRTDLPFAKDVATRLHRRGIPSAGAPASHGRHRPRHLRAAPFLGRDVDLGSVAVVRMGLSGFPRPITASWAGPLPSRPLLEPPLRACRKRGRVPQAEGGRPLRVRPGRTPSSIVS